MVGGTTGSEWMAAMAALPTGPSPPPPPNPEITHRGDGPQGAPLILEEHPPPKLTPSPPSPALKPPLRT